MNPHRGDTPIEVGGEKLTLCYDLNACAMVMDHLNIRSFEAMGNLDLANVGLNDILHILWAGLQRHHPDLDVQDVGAMEWDLNDILPVVGQAFNRGLVRESKADQAAEGGAEGNAGAATGKSGTGKKHSVSRTKRGSGQTSSGG